MGEEQERGDSESLIPFLKVIHLVANKAMKRVKNIESTESPVEVLVHAGGDISCVASTTTAAGG